MKRIIVLGSLGLAAVASIVLLGVVPNLQTARSAGCSNSTLRGAYGWMGDGVVIGAGLETQRTWVSMGWETFDGAGKTSIEQTSNNNGKVGHFNYTGTYTINANCTGTLEYPFPEGTAHVSIVLVDGSREFLWMVLDTPFYPSGVTWHGIAKKI